MKKLILTAVIATTAIFMGAQPAQAADCCCVKVVCLKKKVKTEEIGRRCFCETRCVLGRQKTIWFEEITYRTTYVDCCGKCTYKTFTRVRRCR